MASFRRTLWGIFVLAAVSVTLLGAGVGAGQNDKISEAISLLGHVPAGRALIQRAVTQWRLGGESELVAVFRWGKVSRTDAVLTRQFNPYTGKEYRQREVTIYLRENQEARDLVLDMAHELTHATAGPTWDPYDPGLTASRYVSAAIDGTGGEVDALVSECQVGLQLAINDGLSAVRCRRYLSASNARGVGMIDREKVRRDLYAVGKWRADVIRRLGLEAERFPLSSRQPQLYSSTGGAPYPVALLREFDEMNQIACNNSRKRLNSVPGRSPAEVDTRRDRATEFLSRRCD